MIKAITFRNYRVLRDTMLPLGPFTMIVGPNGSGKSTVMHALRTLRAFTPSYQSRVGLNQVSSVGNKDGYTSVEVQWTEPLGNAITVARWGRSNIEIAEHVVFGVQVPQTLERLRPAVLSFFTGLRTYGLNEQAIVQPVMLVPNMELEENGRNLAGVLDRMRDQTPEAFERLNEEISILLPEFDRILFETPAQGQRAFLLRTREGRHQVGAADLSQGTVLALAILTLAHLETPPSMVCIEEPDRGIHPRLYRDIRDALYRLSYPESFGLNRPPVQVLVTTHSPYLLDLHREHPEEIVIAQKHGSEGKFERLVDREDLDELLSEASLGEIWYSGVLGGVPAGA